MFKKILLLGMLLFVAACGGGVNDDNVDDNNNGQLIDTANPPSIVQSIPDKDATGVLPSTSIRLIFTEDLNPETVTAANLKVTSGATVIGGNLKTAGNIVTFEPSGILPLGAVITIDASGIKDRSGQIMEAETRSFKTASGALIGTFALADSTFFSAGGVAQATIDKVKGVVTVNIKGNAPSDVSARWLSVAIEKDKTYVGSFVGSSTPQNSVQAELKQQGGAFASYASTTVACTGTAKFSLIPNASDLTTGRFNLNFAGAVGTYTVGTITIFKLD